MEKNIKYNIEASKDHYNDIEYDSKERFISYWHQIYETRHTNAEKVLEIGIGNGFVSRYLKSIYLNVITIDINETLNPDVVGSALELPFENNSFDAVLCCEVLEHLPYESFKKALKNIFRVTKKYSIISIPDRSKAIIINIKLFKFKIYKFKVFKKFIQLGCSKKKIKELKEFKDPHFWEIGIIGYPFEKIKKDIEEIGFKIMKTYRIFENPYHRFFLLEKE